MLRSERFCQLKQYGTMTAPLAIHADCHSSQHCLWRRDINPYDSYWFRSMKEQKGKVIRFGLVRMMRIVDMSLAAKLEENVAADAMVRLPILS
jgi:hypothetical protein